LVPGESVWSYNTTELPFGAGNAGVAAAPTWLLTIGAAVALHTVKAAAAIPAASEVLRRIIGTPKGE
jgi:hypothetical protein